MANTTITCPSCGNEFEPNSVIREQIQAELRTQMKDWQLKKEEEFKLKETSFQKQLSAKEEEISKCPLTIAGIFTFEIVNKADLNFGILAEINAIKSTC